MTADDRRALRDVELVDLLADEPELLAIVDAYAATQHRHWRRNGLRHRVWRLGLVTAVIAGIAAPTAAFADQLGRVLGFAVGGTPIATTRLPAKQLSALQDIGFPVGRVRLLAARAGVSFYAAKADDGRYCFAIGLGSQEAPTIDALACEGGTIGSFPSETTPVADFSAVDTTASSTYLTTLAGLATDKVTQVVILGTGDDRIFSTPVERNVYAATNLPHTPASAIIALDARHSVVYRKNVGAPPAPKPIVPTGTTPEP